MVAEGCLLMAGGDEGCVRWCSIVLRGIPGSCTTRSGHLGLGGNQGPLLTDSQQAAVQ